MTNSERPGLRPGLPMPPGFMRSLPLDERGYPVPWFVQWIDGKPEFRIMNSQHLRRAVEEDRCWICGKRMMTEKVFVVGPMCTVNRISAEPPSHRACAKYAAQACPFLTMPKMVRRENNLPDDIKFSESSLAHNPGVTALWYCYRYRQLFIPDGSGRLFQMGQPLQVEWYKFGRRATRQEVEDALESGLPNLEARALRERDPSCALSLLRQKRREVDRFLPHPERQPVGKSSQEEESAS